MGTRPNAAAPGSEREQRGRCARCRRPIPRGTGGLHHVDADPGHDAPSNLVLVHAALQPARPGHAQAIGVVSRLVFRLMTDA